MGNCLLRQCVQSDPDNNYKYLANEHRTPSYNSSSDAQLYQNERSICSNKTVLDYDEEEEDFSDVRL